VILEKVKGSFRDPSGHLFYKKEKLLRVIRPIYKNHYEKLMESGLYDQLITEKKLIPHQEYKSETLSLSGEVYKIIEPEIIPFVSYPYEWCFSQLKDAALLTLEIQKKAFSKGMVLKDASAYNVQFVDCRPVFIDTLSFEEYKPGDVWRAYKQFCQHFLAPLLLMRKDFRFSSMLKSEIDGISLDFARHQLGWKSYFSLGQLLHIHLHSMALNKYKLNESTRQLKISKNAFLGNLDSLTNTIKSIKLKKKKTQWGDYYSITNYTDESFKHKETVVRDMLQHSNPKKVWDFGANNGHFSKIAAKQGAYTIAMDIDYLAVEKNYLANKTKTGIFPLQMNLCNPTPGLGWNNSERESLMERGKVDMGMALALTHHLAISNNLPFDYIADFFSQCCDKLIVEFIPKSDSKVRFLLHSREDVYNDYNIDSF